MRKVFSVHARKKTASPADFNAAVFVNPSEFPQSTTMTYLIYPDQLVGYNFEQQKFKAERDLRFEPLLKGGDVLLSESKHVLRLVSQVYRDILPTRQEITYLPIEFDDIRANTRLLRENHIKRPLRVLWNHMWRKDKGFAEALDIINQLSDRFTGTEFWIARNETWGNDPTKNAETKKQLRSDTTLPLSILHNKRNVFFQPNFTYDKALDYWKFLGQMDIGFSVSHHEGFGLAMLEQASAGIACVMPNRESYPEVGKGGLLTDDVIGGIADLIENPQLRMQISASCIHNARNFNADEWADKMLQIAQTDK